MDDHDDERITSVLNGPGTAAIVFVAPYVGLWILFPVAWAVLTCGLLVMAFGWVTARKILGVTGAWKTLAVSPLLGGLWIGFFYVLIQVLGV
jgi:hypothetical protein